MTAMSMSRNEAFQFDKVVSESDNTDAGFARNYLITRDERLNIKVIVQYDNEQYREYLVSEHGFVRLADPIPAVAR